MTDLTTENARLRAALDEREADMLEWLHKISHPTAAQSPQHMARNYAERLRREMAERAALATPTPDAVQEAARVLLASCPNPLFDRLKPIIMGEVTESIEYTDDVGNERSYNRHVSWTAMKEIIALALRAIAEGPHMTAPELSTSDDTPIKVLESIVRQIDQGGEDGKVFARDNFIARARKFISEAQGKAK